MSYHHSLGLAPGQTPPQAKVVEFQEELNRVARLNGWPTIVADGILGMRTVALFRRAISAYKLDEEAADVTVANLAKAFAGGKDLAGAVRSLTARAAPSSTPVGPGGDVPARAGLPSWALPAAAIAGGGLLLLILTRKA